MRVALIVLPGAGREAGTQERQHLVSAMSSRVRAVCVGGQAAGVGTNYNGAVKSADITCRQAEGGRFINTQRDRSRDEYFRGEEG